MTTTADTGSGGVTPRISPRLIIGLGILLIGLLWTLDNMDLIESEQYTRWWPAVLIAAGIARVLDHSGRAAGVVMIVIGSALLIGSLDLADFDFGDLIPLGIALLGGKLVWDALSRRPASAGGGDSSADINAVAIMSAVKRQSHSSQFRTADATAVMGGVEIDLRSASIQSGQEAVIDTFAFWGGIDIIVPPDWRIVSQVMPLLGGFEDKTQRGTAGGPVLVIRGVAVMGAVEVKN